MSEEGFWERFNEGQMDRRTFVKVASLLGGGMVFGLPLLGCQPAAPKEVQEMKLAWSTPMLSHTPVYCADIRGFFQQEGIKIVITEFAGGSDQVRAVLTGGFPLTVASPTAGMPALEAGEPARFVGGGFDGSQQGFLVRADSPFKKPEDLKGKKIKVGYSRPASASHILAHLSLKSIGIDPNDKSQVEFVSVGGTPDSWTAVRGGVVDVGWSTEPTVSSVEATKEGRVLWMGSDLVKDWTEYGVLTSQGYIDSNPKQLKAWLTAQIKAIDWVKNNLSEAAKDLAKVVGVETAIAEAALKRFPKEAWTPIMRKKAWEFTAQAALEFKLIKAMPNWKVLLNQSFLPENVRDSSWGI